MIKMLVLSATPRLSNAEQITISSNIDTKKHVSLVAIPEKKSLFSQASHRRAIIAGDAVRDHSGAIRTETE